MSETAKAKLKLAALLIFGVFALVVVFSVEAKIDANPVMTVEAGPKVQLQCYATAIPVVLVCVLVEVED